MAFAFTPDEIADINNGTLETYLDKGKVWKQDIANKPMLAAFQEKKGFFPGGKEYVSVAVGSGYGGGSLTGYSGDDKLNYYNPTGIKRARYPWKEMFIGMVVTMTELKYDGITVNERGTNQTTSEQPGREAQALVDLLDEKMEKLANDYTFSLDRLIHGDGSTDTLAIAGIQSLILTAPTTGTTGGINRAANTWWRNDVFPGGAVTVNAAAGGALITAMDKSIRRRAKYAPDQTQTRYFCGSDFIDGYKLEMRSNGTYTQNGWWNNGRPDGAMKDPSHAGIPLVWDPTLDDLGLSKYCYAIDMSKQGIRLMYMHGQDMQKHNPARPYDRMVMYNGISSTGVLVAKRLNTSGVYTIA